MVSYFSMQMTAKDIHTRELADNESYKINNPWKPLFKTAEETMHWESIRNTFPNKGWQIKEKELILLPERKGDDIITKKKYTDFEFKLEFKMTRLVNSKKENIQLFQRNNIEKTIYIKQYCHIRRYLLSKYRLCAKYK